MRKAFWGARGLTLGFFLGQEREVDCFDAYSSDQGLFLSAISCRKMTRAWLLTRSS